MKRYIKVETQKQIMCLGGMHGPISYSWVDEQKAYDCLSEGLKIMEKIPGHDETERELTVFNFHTAIPEPEVVKPAIIEKPKYKKEEPKIEKKLTKEEVLKDKSFMVEEIKEKDKEK